MAAAEIFGITIINSLSLLTWLLHQLPFVTNGKLNKNREVLKCAMSLGVTQMRLSAPPRPPRLFLPVRQISHLCMCVCLSAKKHHLLLSLSITHPLCICVRGKMLVFSPTYLCLVLQVRTRKAAAISTVSSATTTARTQTRWGCTGEPCIFISLLAM